MATAELEQSIGKAWHGLQAALRKLARASDDGGPRIKVWQDADRSLSWQAEASSSANDTVIKAAGEAARTLVGLLPLAHDLDLEISEGAEAYLMQSGLLALVIENRIGDRASVSVCWSAARAVWFHDSRTSAVQSATPWDEACQERLVRPDLFGGNAELEPGIAWFVHWFEDMGCRTLFGCEGHPKGFYIDFVGPTDAEDILRDSGATLEAVSGGLHPAGSLRVSLRQDPSSRAERDEMLRQFSIRIMDADHRFRNAGHRHGV